MARLYKIMDGSDRNIELPLIYLLKQFDFTEDDADAIPQLEVGQTLDMGDFTIVRTA